jgi:hypothetical protein
VSPDSPFLLKIYSLKLCINATSIIVIGYFDPLGVGSKAYTIISALDDFT